MSIFNQRRNRPSFDERIQRFGDALYLEGKRPREHRGKKRMRYWVWANDGGQRWCRGPYNSQFEAEESGTRDLDCFFTVHALNTSNQAEATRMLKEQQLSQSHDLQESTKRVRHKVKEG